MPQGSSSCPTCSTSQLALDGLAIRLSDDERSTRRGRPGVAAGAGSTLATPRFAPGTVLGGRYRISVALGRGGMGEVYRAEDLKLRQEVALKFLPKSMDGEAEKLAILRDEVRLARRIHHPNVCRVFDVGEDSGLHFISMEFIDGEHLASLLRRIGRLPAAKALDLAHELCRGLAAAHGEGILHRDIKPNNLMIDGEGRARITDFGLAVMATGAGDPAARQGGTPAYMAPEQVTGGELSVRSDLYALGLVLYELFTGRRPFLGHTWMELVTAHRDATPPRPSELVHQIDPAIEAAILRCLAKDPADRPPSAAVLDEALPGGDASEAAAAVWRPAAGKPLPRRPHWVMRRKLGQGGFGEAWLAEHAKTREERVFKFCHAVDHLSALKREIALFRLLKQELGERDDITRIFDWSFQEPPYYIESEYTEGGNLIAWAEDEGGIDRVPLAMRLEIVAQVAEALAAAHSVGVLHKDVKPANVLVRRRSGEPVGVQVRLSDFGIGLLTGDARLSEAGITPVSLTWSSGPSGTPLYRAPELLEGKPATVQGDVYALGVMLFQVVVGDFYRALAPGWERDVDDELLREDIALAVDGNPQRRLGNALRIAERLRSLEQRRAELSARRDARQEAERARAALERLRRRLRWTAAAVLSVVLALGAVVQGRRIAGQIRAAEQTRQLVRVAVASDWLARDPTRAALVLLEIDDPDATPEAAAKIREVAREELAVVEVRHGDWVLDVAWSPDGRSLATASNDGTLRVWRADGSGTPTTYSGHGAPVLSVAWSPDGRRLLSTSQDATARIWAPGRPPVVLEGHGDWVWTAAWSGDGERVATASWDGTARIWRLDGEAALEPIVLRGHGDRVVSVAWSPDGGRLVTASWDGSARLWSADGDPLHRGRRGAQIALRSPEALWSASWSGDGERIVTACWDGTARIWRADGSGRPIILRGSGSLWTARWSPDGRRLATASNDGTAQIWTAEGFPLLRDGVRVLLRHGDSVASAAWSPDGERLVTASRDGTARIWNAAGSPVRPLGLRPGSGESLVLRGHGDEVTRAVWSPDGRRVVTASRDGSARIWNVGSRTRPASRVLRSLPAPASLAESRLVAHSPVDERRIRASADGVVRVSGRDGEEIVFRAGGEAPLLAVAFGAGGEKVMTVAADATLRMWNVDGSGEETVRGGLSAGIVPPGGGGAGGEDRRGVVLAASFDPSGERLLTLSAGGAAEVWTLDAYPEGAPVTLAAGDGAAVVSAGWYGDGRRLWTRSTSGTLREWRIDTGELLASFREETTICLDAAFREKNLGEAPEPARAKFASCERLHGRP